MSIAKKTGKGTRTPKVEEAEVASVEAQTGAPPEPEKGEPLTEQEALKVALAQERLTTAGLQLQARKNELEGLVLAIKAKYEEGGKYRLIQLDPGNGTIVREPV